MTVKELIEALQQMPPDLKVEIYDLSDYNEITTVVRRPETNTVVIL
jgi:hypothetical protein